MCIEIELVGGVNDGRRLTLCGDPMNPQQIIRVAEHAPLHLDPQTGQPTVEEALRTFQVCLYVRDPEPRRTADGPHWLYRRKQPEPSA